MKTTLLLSRYVAQITKTNLLHDHLNQDNQRGAMPGDEKANESKVHGNIR